MIWVQCPYCRLAQGFDDHNAEPQQQCAACGRSFRVPGTATTAPSADACTVYPLPQARERRSSAPTYGVESAAEPVPERGRRLRRRRRRARTAGPRTFEECWREHPARKGLGVFLLFIPLFLEGFAPGISPLALVLPLSIIGGIAAGLLFAPDLRRLAVGLVPGLLAGILTPLALHGYVAFTPQEYQITSKELAVVWAMSLTGPAALYCVLLWLTLPRYGRAALSSSGPEPVTFRARPTIWGLLIASGFFLVLGGGCWAVMLHEPPIPQKLLLLFMGGLWVALGLLIVVAGLKGRRTGARRRRGRPGLD